MTLEEAIGQIRPRSAEAEKASWDHWDSLCKPLRGFGRMEEMVAQLAAIRGTAEPHIEKRAVVIMGADNGVVAEGVSQTGSEVTKQVLENMGQRISSVCVMSKILNMEVIPVNIGMNTDAEHPRVRNMAVKHGTGDIMVEPAMTREECIKAIETGINIVGELAEEGYDLILTGEMGIGNTTTSSACACVLFGATPEQMTGRGAGLSTPALKHKVEVVRKAIEVNAPDPTDAIDIMAKVGGLDIAGMVGLYLGAAAYHLPVFIDGVISGISACFAQMLCPTSVDYMFPSHATAEPAGALINERLGMDPILHAGMHLGEATGAAATVPFLDQALNVYYSLPKFADANVEQYEHQK